MGYIVFDSQDFTGATAAAAGEYIFGVDTSGVLTIKGNDGISATFSTSLPSPISGIPFTTTDYSTLLNDINTSNLTVGGYYLLNDFRTVHYVQFTDVVGDGTGGSEVINQCDVEPLILKALDTNTLDTRAFSPLYPQDEIYYLPNTTDRSYDYVTGNRGVITKRKDIKLNIERDYDFRNVKFRRWNNGVGIYDVIRKKDANFPLDFITVSPFDPSLLISNTCYNNTIGSPLGRTSGTTFSIPYQLDNITFKTTSVVNNNTIKYGYAFDFGGQFATSSLPHFTGNEIDTFIYNKVKNYNTHFFSSDVEIAAWKYRSINGPYKTTGDIYTYSYADWTNVINDSDLFIANPFGTVSNFATCSIWDGYSTGVIDTNSESPKWEGVNMTKAALRYMVTGETASGNAVRLALLQQLAISNQTDPASKTTNPDTWSSSTSNPDGVWTTNPTVAGIFVKGTGGNPFFQEAYWVNRIIFSYDGVKDLMTPSEQAGIEDYFDRWAKVVQYSEINTPNYMAACYPNMFTNEDFTTRAYVAAANGSPYMSNSPIYQDGLYPYHDRWYGITGAPGDYIYAQAGSTVNPSYFIYTHLNSDSTLGNKISRVADKFDNQTLSKNSTVGKVGALLNNSSYMKSARAVFKGFIYSSTYKDGTTAEYKRNGSNNRTSQGAFIYNGINISAYLMMADNFARRGDYSLFTYSTPENDAGIHGATGSRNIWKVIDRMNKNIDKSDPIYAGITISTNLITDLQPQQTTGSPTYNAEFYVYKYMNAYANKWSYNNPNNTDYVRFLYENRLGTQNPMTNGSNTNTFPNIAWRASGNGLYFAWGGPMAEFPAYNFMYAGLERLSVYNAQVSGMPNLLPASASSLSFCGNKINTFVNNYINLSSEYGSSKGFCANELGSVVSNEFYGTFIANNIDNAINNMASHVISNTLNQLNNNDFFGSLVNNKVNNISNNTANDFLNNTSNTFQNNKIGIDFTNNSINNQLNSSIYGSIDSTTLNSFSSVSATASVYSISGVEFNNSTFNNNLSDLSNVNINGATLSGVFANSLFVSKVDGKFLTASATISSTTISTTLILDSGTNKFVSSTLNNGSIQYGLGISN